MSYHHECVFRVEYVAEKSPAVLKYVLIPAIGFLDCVERVSHDYKIDIDSVISITRVAIN